MSRFRPRSSRGWIAAAVLMIALVATPFALAQQVNNGRPLIGGKRSPSEKRSDTYTAETEIIANTSTYGTRQSNKSNNGGGAIYGCRSGQGGTPQSMRPCIRSSNLSTGRAFEFSTGNGPEVGAILSSNANAAPFTTNATGIATGLNADRLDGKHAAELLSEAKTAAEEVVAAKNLFAKVEADGTLASGRGASSATTTATGNYSVVFTTDIDKCALNATQQTITDSGAVGVELQADKRTVLVLTRAGGGASGTDPTDPADRPFDLTVTC